MADPITTDNFVDMFALAFNEVAVPAFEKISIDIEGVKKGLTSVENRLTNVEEDMATKDDLKNFEERLNKRFEAIIDTQDNHSERLDDLESSYVVT